MDQSTAPALSSESPQPSGFKRWLSGPWPIVLLFFIAALVFNTRNNGLPYYYEKDAPSKVYQVVSGERNFFHPLLMLNTADVILTLSGAERTNQNAAIAGRTAIALLTSIGIAAFTMLAWRMEGRAAALATGALLFTSPMLFELSHIFKEDPALIAGLGLAYLAMHIFWKKRGAYQAAWMGAAVAIAISGKYVGVATLVMAVALLLLVRNDQPKRNRGRWIAFLVTLLLTLSVVNYQLIANLPSFVFGFKTEMADLTRKDKIDDIPHVRKTREVLEKNAPLLLALSLGLFIIHTALRRRRDPIRWLLILYPIVFTVILAYSPRLFSRHFLPVIVLINVAGAIGMVAVLRSLLKLAPVPEQQSTRLVLPITLGLVTFTYLTGHQRSLLKYVDVFAHPTRETFIREAIYKLPPDAVIAADARVHLLDGSGKPRTHLPVSQKVIVASRIAHLGSLDNLRSMGVTHVAVHGIDSRYLFKQNEDSPNNQGDGEEGTLKEETKKKKKKRKKKKKKKFDPSLYDELRDESKLVYVIRGKGSTYHAPALRLYKLKPPKVKGTPEATVPTTSKAANAEAGAAPSLP